MEIFLELRLQTVTTDGTSLGLIVIPVITQPNRIEPDNNWKDSIRWKLRPMAIEAHEIVGAMYNIYHEGTYTETGTDFELTTLRVRAEYQHDLTINVTEQLNGFTPRGKIINIPLHITTVMQSDDDDPGTMIPGINNIGPMEGGIRMQDKLNNPVTAPGTYTDIPGGPLLGTAMLEHNIVHECYEVIPPECIQHDPTP